MAKTNSAGMITVSIARFALLAAIKIQFDIPYDLSQSPLLHCVI